MEARQLVSDLSLFVSAQATIVANEAGNSIVVTDTQANIRHLAEIIKSVDDSAESETEIRVFRLQYASPVDVANEIEQRVPQLQFIRQPVAHPVWRRPWRSWWRRWRRRRRWRWWRRFGGGGFGGGLAALFGGGGGGNTTQQRIQKATQVTAVADSRIQAVIVTAPKDLMDEIAGMMDELDVASDRDQNVATIQLQNGDPQQVAQVLQSMFRSSNASRTGSSSQTAHSCTRSKAARPP